jgi:Leucine-rich repeat (LRR) protein
VLKNVRSTDDESMKQVFAAVGKLTYLKELELKCLTITQACSDSLAEVLPSLQLLEKLVLKKLVLKNVNYRYDDDNESGKQLFAAVGKLTYLKELELGCFTITQAGADSLVAEVLPSLQLMEKLVLQNVNCHRDDESGKQLFTAVGKLMYLKELEFKCYIITQACSDSLAEVLPSLQFLEKLVLGYVNYDDDIDDESKKQLFAAVGKLTCLKELDIKWCRITQAGANSLAEVLPSLQSLEKLVLADVDYDDDIDDESEKQLFTAVGKLMYLKELQLQWYKITQAGADSLAEVLPSLQLLEKLVLKNVNYDDDIDDESKKQLFAAVGKLTYLKELELMGFNITQAGADSLAEVLPSLQFLEKLMLENVNYGDDIDDESGKQLFAAVGKLTYLKELELKWYKITQAGADSLAEVLPSLQLLEKLVLGNVRRPYNVNHESQKQLLAAVGKLTYLKEFQLWCVKISHADADCLAEVLPSLQLLERLVFRGIVFRNINDHQLFSAVGSLSCLKELDLSWTDITDAGAENLIDVLPSLRHLTCITLPEIYGTLRSRLEATARQVPRLKVK